MKVNLYTLAVVGTLAFTGMAYGDHDKACKNIHGRVTVVTEDGITVNEKLYRVGETTRLTKDGKSLKLTQITAGDIVCVDTRGKDDIGREVAAVTVLGLTDQTPVKEREFVREKQTIKPIAHDRTCQHVHGKVVRVSDHTLIVAGKPYECRETTKIMKGNELVEIETIKAGDFVCINDGDDGAVERKVTTVMVLNPSEASAFESREVIREREKVRERIREEK